MNETNASFVLVNETQYIVSIGIGMISSVLSMLGSASILFLIRAHSTVFEQLMFGICVADLLSTISAVAQPYFLPKYTLLPFANGNAATCRSLGFLFYAFLASAVYSLILSHYFWASLRQVQNVPPSIPLWIHILPWATMLVYGTVAITLDAINPSMVLGICLADCRIDPVTWECTENGIVPHALRRSAASIVMASALVGIYFLVRIQRHVHHQEKRNGRYDFTQSNETTLETRPRRTRRMKATMMQALCYSLAFLNSFLAIGVAITGKEVLHGVLGLRNNWLFFGVEVYVYAMFPLQGFLNWLVFIRPKVIQWKETFQDMSYFWCLRQTILDRQSLVVRERTLSMDLPATTETS